MGITARGLRYPEAMDRPHGPDQIRALAEDIEAAAVALTPDSGTRSDLPVTPAAGFELMAGNYRLIGKNMVIAVWLKRTGAPLNATAAGNIGDTLAATITDPAYRPSMDTNAALRAYTTGGEASVISSSGNIFLVSLQSSSAIATHTDETPSIVRIYATYAVL